MAFSNRINAMQASPIRKLIPIADETRSKGIKVYPLNIGQPDITTPPEYLEAISNYKGKVLAYANSHGIPELLDTFQKYFKKYEIDFSADEIIVTNGVVRLYYLP